MTMVYVYICYIVTSIRVLCDIWLHCNPNKGYIESVALHKIVSMLIRLFSVIINGYSYLYYLHQLSFLQQLLFNYNFSYYSYTSPI